jgi:hypothetical protein
MGLDQIAHFNGCSDSRSKTNKKGQTKFDLVLLFFFHRLIEIYKKGYSVKKNGI